MDISLKVNIHIARRVNIVFTHMCIMIISHVSAQINVCLVCTLIFLNTEFVYSKLWVLLNEQKQIGSLPILSLTNKGYDAYQALRNFKHLPNKKQ